MYEPVKFKRLNEIVKELSHKIAQLHDGQLSKTDLENMTEESRELYERLVVLRFKAFQEEVDTEQTVIQDEIPAPVAAPVEVQNVQDEPQVIEPISFRIDTTEKIENSTQVSLIDAIEEVIKESVVTESAPIAHPEQQPVSSTVENITKEGTSLNEKMKQAVKENFYEKLAKTIEQKETFNNKMEQSSIPDLKRAISLNQRFQFSKELFKGNNQDYEVAIEKLNTTTREEAMKQLESLRSKYDWSSTSAIASDFVDLVERRYL